MQVTELVNLFALVVVAGGFLSFLATQLIKQASWPSWLKLILSLAMAAAFGLATGWVNGDVWHIINGWGGLTAQEVLSFGGIIWASATGWYVIAFKNATWAANIAAWPKK